MVEIAQTTFCDSSAIQVKIITNSENLFKIEGGKQSRKKIKYKNFNLKLLSKKNNQAVIVEYMENNDKENTTY